MSARSVCTSPRYMNKNRRRSKFDKHRNNRPKYSFPIYHKPVTMKPIFPLALFTTVAFAADVSTANCFWDGVAPMCKGKCPSGFVEERRDLYGDGSGLCWRGYKVWCCQK